MCGGKVICEMIIRGEETNKQKQLLYCTVAIDDALSQGATKH